MAINNVLLGGTFKTVDSKVKRLSTLKVTLIISSALVIQNDLELNRIFTIFFFFPSFSRGERVEGELNRRADRMQS